MKKFAIMILASIVIISFALDTGAYARYIIVRPSILGVVSGSELKNVEFSTGNDHDIIQIHVGGLKDYKVFKLPDPNRIVIDIPNVKASVIQKKVDVEGKFAKSVRWSQFDDDTARVVIDLKEEAQYYIKKELDKLVVYVVRPIVDKLIYFTDEDGGNLVLDGIRLYDDNEEPQKLFTESKDFLGKKYTISFPSSLGEVKNIITRINDSFINMIRVYSSEVTGKTSITLYAKERLTYEVNQDNETGSTTISFKKNSSGDENSQEPEKAKLDVKYTSLAGSDRITLMADRYAGYNIFRLTDPDRIVIDIPNVSSGQNTINVGSGRLKAVRYAQHNSDTARVVLDTKGLVQYDVVERDGQLIIDVYNPTFRNLAYHSSGDRVYLTLDGAVLTEGGSDLKKYYTGKYDPTGQKYTMTFRSNLANIGSGVIEINDNYLKSIEITTDVKSKYTSITFNAKDRFVYEVMTRTAVDDTAITILKPYSKKDKLVVIDAGHGDVEPGAVYAGVKEKDLNLDIALRLDSLLESKGINTYMLREDDSYVGLYERAYIANSLNATLFLSIHNNAFNKSEHGTETLYFPGRENSAGFSSKRFAQLIQNELISALKTKDRKLKERPGLVVLKATKMPAALAEVAFLTNDSDRKNLLDKNFRQKAAEALCKAVIKALDEN